MLLKRMSSGQQTPMCLQIDEIFFAGDIQCEQKVSDIDAKAIIDKGL